MNERGSQAARRSVLRGVLIGVGITASILVAAEWVVQIWARYYRTAYESYDRSAGTPSLIPGFYPVEKGPAIEVNPSGFVGPPLADREEGLRRIITLGDSCTVGAGSNAYPAMLQQRLRQRSVENRRYEVVNAAISGLDSEQALRRLASKGPGLDPEVVTVYIGWNDLMKFAPCSQTRGALLSPLSRFMDRLWLVRGLRKLLFFHIRPRSWVPLTGPSSRTGRFAGFKPSYFEENLRAIVHTSRELGARALLLTLPSPIHLGMTVQELRRAHIQFPYFASCYAVGDFIDLVESYNRTIRRVAEEEQVAMVDLAGLFWGIPYAQSYFWDSMHPSMQGRHLIAQLIERALIREGLVAPPAGSAASQISGSTD